MGAALRIDDADVVQLAKELAELRHVSIQDAVATALTRNIAWEREVRQRQERIEQIARAVHANLTKPLPSSDHSWMYDEHGLPA